ncbi:MAG: FtsX-like permease family protein, partial [Ignavibacteriaceae bacterium]
LLTFISFFIAVLFVEILLPLFNNIADKNLHTNYFHSLVAIPALFAAIIIIGLISGSYPAFFLSSFQPSRVLKGKATGTKGSWLRSGLVIFQFSISIILFIGTMIIYNQMKFIQEADLGFNKEHVLVIQRAWALENHTDAFKDELLKNPHIISAANTNDLPGRIFSETVFKLENAPASKQFLMGLITTDGNFAKTMGIELAGGRYFSKDNPSDSLAVVINESAVKTFDLKDPLGKRIIFSGQNLTCNIIGVVKDFHLRSLHQKMEPFIIYFSRGQTNYLPIRISSNDISGTISTIKNEWKKFVQNKPFEYFFLDEDLNRLYHSDQKTGQILTSFSMLAIFIACLGLFGLAAFTTERRTKEIGIRKALGATVLNVIFILSKEFTKWVLVANIIAWPVAYYFMNKWLQDFAYRINIGVWIFILSGILALLIALLTVISHAVKAARANPVKSLRYE